MKRGKLLEKESLEDFEKRVGLDSKKAVSKVPNNILVQRMSSTASGRLKKYEPLDRDPSRTKFEQIKGRKVYFIRFTPSFVPKKWKDWSGLQTALDQPQFRHHAPGMVI